MWDPGLTGSHWSLIGSPYELGNGKIAFSCTTNKELSVETNHVSEYPSYSYSRSSTEHIHVLIHDTPTTYLQPTINI